MKINPCNCDYDFLCDYCLENTDWDALAKEWGDDYRKYAGHNDNGELIDIRDGKRVGGVS